MAYEQDQGTTSLSRAHPSPAHDAAVIADDALPQDRIQASDYVVASHGNASPSDRGADRQSEDGQGEDVIRMPQPSGPLGSPPPDDSAPASSFPAKTSPSAKSSSRGGSTWSRGHRRMNDAANSFFYRLGYWVATHAKSTVLISLVLVAACCFGFASFRQETDGEDLWVPLDSLSNKQEDIVLGYFDDDGGYAIMLLDSPSQDGSILTKNALDAVWELNSAVYSIEVDGKTYSDLCTLALDGVSCDQPARGITRLWNNDFETYQDSVTSDADILSAVNVQSYPDGQAVNLAAVFGNSMTFDASGDVAGARAVVQMYKVRSDDEALSVKWEGAFQDALGELSEAVTIFDVNYFTGRSIDDALEESTSGEVFLFVITYLIMITFAMIALGRCCSGPVRRRSGIGLGGVMLVIAAGFAAYGLNSALGVPFTALSTILPFILVGIGVDDMFVIVSAFDHTDAALPVEERAALGLKRCGVSIAYTSLTNFLAFMLGSVTSIPAVRYFCLYAGTAILFDYFLQITAFVALLTMDANRQRAGRIDGCCCCKSQTYREQKRAKRDMAVSAAVKDHHTKGGKAAEVRHLNRFGRFMEDKYTPALLSTKGKAVVLIASAALLSAGVYGVTRATQGFEVLDLAPDGHHAQEYTERARTYDLELDTQYLPLGVYTREVDYPDAEVQAQIQATDALMVNQRFVVGPVDSWLSSFLGWAANSTEYSANVGTREGFQVYEDRDTFYTALQAFTQDGENIRFLSNIFYDGDGKIEMSRSRMFLVDLTDVENNIDALKDTREVVAQSSLEPEPFGFSGIFVFTEQYLVIYDELIFNFILALVAVAVLSVCILGRIAVVMLVCATVVMIDVELLGFVYHWGLDVNGITVIELIMAVGLVVDYIVHIVHYFLHQDPSIPKDARIAKALGEIGPSVITGATTTFLGIMPLAFASNAIFRVFFKMFLVIITFGCFHGVVFIPVVLSLLPDCAFTSSDGHDRYSTEDTAQQAKRAPFQDKSHSATERIVSDEGKESSDMIDDVSRA